MLPNLKSLNQSVHACFSMHPCLTHVFGISQDGQFYRKTIWIQRLSGRAANRLMKNKMGNGGAGQWSAVLAFCRGQRSSGADNLECVHSSVKTQVTDQRSLFSENTDSKNTNLKGEDMTSNTGLMKRGPASSKGLNSHSFGRHF